MPIAARQTFLKESGPADDPERLHLHIVCFDVDDDGKTMVVSVSSCAGKPFYDKTCILTKGEHSSITRDSFVSYQHSEIVDAAAVQAGLDTGKFIPYENMRQYPFLRVRNRAGNSRFIPPKVKKYFLARMQSLRVL